MINRTSKFVVGAVAAACFATLGSTSGVARACGDEWGPEVEIDYRVQGVARAEKAFNDGKVVQAAASVIRMMPHVRGLDPKRSNLVERAQHLLAVAAARSGGALPVAKEVPDYALGQWLGRTAEARARNLDWSIQALRNVAELKKDDPVVQTELAEALARVPAHQGEARSILEGLAKRDLVASPEGYAVLARLRAQAGDEKGQKLAVERCSAMSKDSALCTVPQGKAQS